MAGMAVATVDSAVAMAVRAAEEAEEEEEQEEEDVEHRDRPCRSHAASSIRR
jgi:hypothetical protein